MFFFLVLKYGIKYHFATNIYFSTICFSSIQKAPIGILGKGYLNFRKHPSIGVSKNNCSGNVCKIPSKTFSVESFFSTFADLPGRF